MIKEFSLLLLIFLFLSIVYYFLFKKCNINIEKFIDKSDQKIFTMKDRTFTFEKDKITINPDFTFTSPLEKVVVSKLSDLKYNYSINNIKCIIDIAYNDNPININVNDFSFTINIKKSKKNQGALNIFIYDKVCGSIKNKILKTNSPEIYNDVEIVGVIFLSYLIYNSIEDFYTKDYDKDYSSNNKSIYES